MNRVTSSLGASMVVLWGLLASGCSPGAHSTASRSVNMPVYLAQAADCTQVDSTMTCCIKKNPTNAAEACGAAAWEIAEALNGAKVLSEALPQADAGTSAAEVDDFANNAHLPEWKQRCIRFYVDCQNERWTGNCNDCLRRCEGQHDWPFGMCEPRSQKR